jgi:hypothetical protein
MALRKPFVISSEGYHEEIPVADALDVGAITINASGAGIDAGAKQITNIGDGTADSHALNKGQIDALVATGNIFKEPVFAEFQLIDGASGGIAALGALFFANTPTVGDQVRLSDGTNTRDYTFVANQGAESAENDVSIETSAITAMQRLVTRMNADSTNTWWTGEFHTPGEFNTAGEVHIKEDKTPADTLSTSRIFANTWTTAADFQVITFSDGATADQYNAGTQIQAPGSDPAGGRFGLSRAEATLVDGEVHLALDLNAQFSWEDSSQVWNQISGSGAIPDATSGAGGDVKGLATFDEDKGLQVVSGGIAEVRLEAAKGVQFESGGGLGVKIDDTPDTLDVDADGLKVVGLPSQFKIAGSAVSSNVTQSNVDTLVAGGSSDADALHTHDGKSDTGHTHTHASTTGQTANDHHNQSHVLDGGDHTVSGLTSGHILTATSATTFAFAAPGAASEVPKIEDTVTTATDATTNGDPVYINGNNTFGKARADTDAKARVTGIIRTGAGAAPASVEVVSAGPCTSVLGGGGTANTPYYLGATGGITSAIPGAGNRIICVGYALNANDLFVRITDYGKKAP